jgi:hypothetical protein
LNDVQNIVAELAEEPFYGVFNENAAVGRDFFADDGERMKAFREKVGCMKPCLI